MPCSILVLFSLILFSGFLFFFWFDVLFFYSSFVVFAKKKYVLNLYVYRINHHHFLIDHHQNAVVILFFESRRVVVEGSRRRGVVEADYALTRIFHYRNLFAFRRKPKHTKIFCSCEEPDDAERRSCDYFFVAWRWSHHHTWIVFVVVCLLHVKIWGEYSDEASRNNMDKKQDSPQGSEESL